MLLRKDSQFMICLCFLNFTQNNKRQKMTNANSLYESKQCSIKLKIIKISYEEKAKWGSYNQVQVPSMRKFGILSP